MLCYDEIMNTKTLVILAIIIAVSGAVLLFRDSGEKPGSAGDSSGLVVSNSAIYVAEQMPGQSVSVSIARLEKPGFVVIHEDAAGATGQILGVSRWLPVGETKIPLPIRLSRATTDGETIYAMLHFDNGDGQFDATDDEPVLDSVDGDPMMMVVTVSQDATEPGVVNP